MLVSPVDGSEVPATAGSKAENSMLEPEAIQAALMAAAGEVQALMNHMGLAARSSPTAKFVLKSDLQSSFRRALQFGRTELVSVDSSLGKTGALAEASDVVVAAKARTPQFAAEVQFHPRGEDHVSFASDTLVDVVKMALARSREAVEQAAVLVAAPARFWRWLPGYADDRLGYELLNPGAETPASVSTDFLGGSSWDGLFEAGMDRELPERLWTASLGAAPARSPWAELEIRLLEVKGLGKLADVRS